MRIAGRPATGPSSRPPHAEPGSNRARATCGKRDRSGKGGSRAVASDGEVAVPLALNIADTTGPTRTTPRRAAWRSGRLLERPVDGAAADAQRPGDPGHGDALGFVPGPRQPGLLLGKFGGPAAQAAAGPRGGAAHRRPFGDQLPLELGERGEDMEGQTAGAGGAVDPLAH